MNLSSFSRRSWLTGLWPLAGCARRMRSGFSGFAFVANEEGQAVAAVDLGAFAVVRHIPLGSGPTQLAGDASRHAVYALTPASGTVHEISTTALRRQRWTTVCQQAAAMQIDSQGLSLWVLGRHPSELARLDLNSFEVDRRLRLPFPAVDFDLSPEGTHAVISFGERAEAALADLTSLKMRMVACGAPIAKARFRKDGRQWIAGHQTQRMLSIFDTASGRLVVRLPLAMRPDHFCFKADGGQLFVTGEGMDAVAIVYPYSTEIAETVLAGNAPGAMAASPGTTDGPEFLFVTNPRSGQLTIINIETRRVVAVTQVGDEPSFVAVTPNNQYALVLNRRSGDMAVVMIQSGARRTRFPAAMFTMIPVGSRPVSAVVQVA